MNSDQQSPFTAHKSTQFDKLIEILKKTNVISLTKIDSAHKIKFEKIDVFHEVFSIIFLKYSTPYLNNILLCKANKQIILKGENIEYTPERTSNDVLEFLKILMTKVGYAFEEISNDALEVLKILITKEDAANYENAFNSLICVLLGSIKPCKFIYPNTYIIELGKDTHEFDVLACTNENKYIVIESTRGFDKKLDNIDETYTWHFKKALFRKWMVEKIYNIDCKLIYLSLKDNLSVSSSKLPIPEGLNQEANSLNESQDNSLISKLLQLENPNISIIDFSEDLLMSLNKEKIITSVYNKIYQNLLAVI